MSEVWLLRTRTYAGVNNDFCDDWMPHMLGLGYTPAYLQRDGRCLIQCQVSAVRPACMLVAGPDIVLSGHPFTHRRRRSANGEALARRYCNSAKVKRAEPHSGATIN